MIINSTISIIENKQIHVHYNVETSPFHRGKKCKFPNFKDGIFFNDTSNHCATERKNKYFLNK